MPQLKTPRATSKAKTAASKTRHGQRNEQKQINRNKSRADIFQARLAFSSAGTRTLVSGGAGGPRHRTRRCWRGRGAQLHGLLARPRSGRGLRAGVSAAPFPPRPPTLQRTPVHSPPRRHPGSARWSQTWTKRRSTPPLPQKAPRASLLCGLGPRVPSSHPRSPEPRGCSPSAGEAGPPTAAGSEIASRRGTPSWEWDSEEGAGA